MGLLIRICLLFLLLSCAKISYLLEQGKGQLSLEYNDIDVKEFLENPSYNKEHQRKVKLIISAKNYFYKYFNLEINSIYSEVKILDQKAVSYLVIHSPANEIRAIETWFPIVGNFPYLGFFKKESAKKYVTNKKAQGYHVYMRDVYAYSTLNHPLMPFDDNILSSFFIYSDDDLVEMIFHELVHTVFFIKNKVALNENIANFIAQKLLFDYQKLSKQDIKKILFQKEKMSKLGQKVFALSKILTKRYEKSDNHKNVLKNFLENDFYFQIKQYCTDEKINNCWPLRGEWNNARFAALGTYQNKLTKLEKIFENSGLSLKDFVKKLIDISQNYDDSIDFMKHLRESLK